MDPAVNNPSPEHAGDEQELVTHSRKVAFRACRRRHHYAYELGVRPVKTGKPLLVGTALHAWLQEWFLAGGREWLCPVFGPWLAWLEAVPTDAMRAFDQVAADDVFEAAKLRAMVLAYHLRWHLQRWAVLAVEVEFRAPLTNPLTNRTSRLYQRAGKIDAMVQIELADGGPEWEGQWIVEHKSNQGPLDPESTYWQKLRLDPQCSDYWIGAHALGFKPRGILYDVVCKPKLEPLKATPLEKRKMTQGNGCKVCGGAKGRAGVGYLAGEINPPVPCASCKATGWRIGEEPAPYANIRLEDETPGEFGLRCFQAILAEPDRYLHRHRVVRLEHEMHEHMVDDWHTVKALHDQRGTPAARNPDACFIWGRPCEYFRVCTGSASIDDQRLFQTGRRHPELRVVNDG